MMRLLPLVLLLAGCVAPMAVRPGAPDASERPLPPTFTTQSARGIVASVAAERAGETVTLHLTARGGVSAFGEPRRTATQIRLPIYHMGAADDVRIAGPVGIVRAARVVPEGEHAWLEIDLSEPATAEVGFGQRAEDLFVYVSPGEAPPARSFADAIADLPAPPRTSPPRASDDAAMPPTSGAPPGNPMVSGARWRFDTIVIDAGHGGKDPGAVAHGVREKDVALSVALKVGRYVEEELGVRVVYTRTSDHFVTLRNRGRIANEAGGKLFVSIHANAATNAQAYGTETFFLGLHKNEAAREVMERENSVVRLEEDQSVYEDLDDEALIVRTMANSLYLQKSESLAALIEGQFRNRVGRKSRGVKQAGFLVLWGASMPAVLVELGFLTNASEAAFLRTEQGQDYMASAIFRAIRDFKEVYDRETLGVNE
jgi:N-acetylmuramoyl-L-alanine amidase